MSTDLNVEKLIEELNEYKRNVQSQIEELQTQHAKYKARTEKRITHLEDIHKSYVEDAEQRYNRLKERHRNDVLKLETNTANLTHEVDMLKRSFQVIAGFEPHTSELVPKACLWSDENTICNISGIYSCIGWHEHRPVYMNTEKRFFLLYVKNTWKVDDADFTSLLDKDIGFCMCTNDARFVHLISSGWEVCPEADDVDDEEIVFDETVHCRLYADKNDLLMWFDRLKLFKTLRQHGLLLVHIIADFAQQLEPEIVLQQKLEEAED